jgi:hypothetical protein
MRARACAAPPRDWPCTPRTPPKSWPGWLKQQPQVKRILYPPAGIYPGHALWRRDLKGANGLLAIELAPHIAPAAADRFHR